ncbi:hypothetical protein B0H16DRAFT_1705875 [Mycena metata]|uniref:Uncharacterized protein n=1 Tax=Mycena metata TaxID=1033252 RepID=A0AAD7DVE1_9AGAR|nr:hypothetical protein B0H16DRAFT_1705875 [Mycena metata]
MAAALPSYSGAASAVTMAAATGDEDGGEGGGRAVTSVEAVVTTRRTPTSAEGTLAIGPWSGPRVRRQGVHKDEGKGVATAGVGLYEVLGGHCSAWHHESLEAAVRL